MSHAAPRRGAFSRILAAVAAGILLASTSAVAVSAAPAEGYVGTGDTAAFDAYGGTYTLPLMTAGEPYSATLTGPQYINPMNWCWEVVGGALPEGISMATPEGACAPSATFSGTPEAGEFSFELRLGDMPVPESTLTLFFEGVVESGKSPTLTTVTAPAFGPNTGFTVSASVAGNPSVGHHPTGTVEFYAGAHLLGSGTLADGTVTVTATLPRGDAGSSFNVTAAYLGDADYQPSVSSATAVAIYLPNATGVVSWNGLVVEDATVELLSADDAQSMLSTTTDGDGRYTLSPAVASLSDVELEYLVRVTFSDSTVLYARTGSPGVVHRADASEVGPQSWAGDLDVERRTAPVWTDATLATPRDGADYDDGVAASSHNTVTYAVSAGTLPAGLSLASSSGAVTGTPTAEGAYDFTIEASNGYGEVTQRFTGTVLPAGVPPTWEDDELPDLRESVAVDDGVLAVGDPTITYAITSGTLPAGLVLDAVSGAIMGTPTTAGPYEFTVTAANDFGSVDAAFEGEVAAKPALGLQLDFAPGTSIDDAETTISAEGLLPGSEYTLTMFSTPRVLYTGIVNASGGFTWVVKLPADTPAGAHRLLLTGTAANGTPMSAQAWFSLRSNGTIGAVSYGGPVGGLAATGSEPWAAALLGGTLLLLGAGVSAVRRRVTAD